MKEIHIDLITEAVAKCCISSCVVIDEDIRAAIETSKANEEKGSLAESVLDNLLKNSQIAIDKNLPICQDTGMVVVFVEIGQDCRIIGGSLESAINKGVAQGYKAGYLRKSVISDPLRRVNTQDNTPAVVHYNIVEGDGLKITVSPKGFGSENMSRIKMLKPSDGKEGIIDFVLDTVIKADSNPCPPIIVGIGIGGTFEKSALIAKLALQRKLGLHNPDKFWAEFEIELLGKINATGIGAGGLGGKTTALAVHIETYATHIAGLPVAVNIGCHVTRHNTVVL